MNFLQRLRIRQYYFNLYVWTQFNQQFRAFSGIEAHTIHRALLDDTTGDFGPKTLHGLLAPHLRDFDSIEALDAGCGYGGTCLDLHRQHGGRWHGITISGQQAQIAAKNAAASGVADAVTFARASYDDPLDHQYNFVFAIESLIHSYRPAHSIANLAASLRGGGRCVIVDDMPVENMAPEFEADLAAFKRGWQCPEMPDTKTWTAYLEQAGCKVEDVVDLTHLMRPRTQQDLDAAEADIRKKYWWRPWLGLGSLTGAEIGGLLLEKLGREGAVRYQMIVARKI